MTLKSALLLAVPVFCLTSCFMGDNSPTQDDANDAAGTGDPYLAREVVAVRTLTTDAQYLDPCNYLGEEFVMDAFKVKEGEMKAISAPAGCTFEWGKNKVALSFGGHRPFESIYAAEYRFDKLYQPRLAAVTTGQMGVENEKPALSGPDPEGTGANGPATGTVGLKNDKTPGNDTATSVSAAQVPIAAKFTEPVENSGRFVAVPEVGDKAVWEPAKKTIHVLYNNHIVNVMVDTKESPAVQQQKAGSMAKIILTKFEE